VAVSRHHRALAWIPQRVSDNTLPPIWKGVLAGSWALARYHGSALPSMFQATLRFWETSVGPTGTRTLKQTGRNKLSSPLNPGAPFDLDWIRSLVVPEKRASDTAHALAAWQGPAEGERVGSLLKVLAAIDLTALSGDDTSARIRSLCRQARSPLPRGLRNRLGLSGPPSRVAAVCVFPAFLPVVVPALDGTGVKVATVAAGFPHGLSDLSQRILEVETAVAAGAQEVDIVVRREWALVGSWKRFYEEIRAFRDAAGPAVLKVILSTGELGTLSRISRATLTAMLAGADFVKTSTGKERVNATFEAGFAMARAIRLYQDASGRSVGLKPAGGIQTEMDGLRWLRLVEEELGPGASDPSRFRIGASSLLGNVLRALEAALQG
jgi:deoxyribose-phosphate aldolase